MFRKEPDFKPHFCILICLHLFFQEICFISIAFQYLNFNVQTFQFICVEFLVLNIKYKIESGFSA